MFKTKQQLLKLKHILTNRISASVVFTTNIINDTFSVKSKGALLTLFVRLVEVIGLRISSYKVRVILAFIFKLSKLYRHRGMKGMVLYLKACQVLFQQSLGGMRLGSDLNELKVRPSRTKAGMPRIVPAQWRFQVRQGDTLIMKLIMTLLALYRVLEFPGKLKLSTITDSFKGSLRANSKYWRVINNIPNFVKLINAIQQEYKVTPLQVRGIAPRPIIKSAPGVAGGMVSTTPFALLLAARAYSYHGLQDCMEFFIKFFEKGTKVPFPGLMRVFQSVASLPINLMPSMNNIPLGRLALKHEPAGKIRVFAMCDAWTQWALEPLHSWLFDTLRHISTDGTFDQMKPVYLSVNKYNCGYSLDLSAATDRLPISIQVKLLSALINKDFAIQWARLLVGRTYYLPGNPKLGIESQDIKYSVGQPMGALSSWAMLAMTHHLIVQVAAWEAGYPVKEWYSGYAVLGDDLVIFDPKVKDQYLLILADLGVECGIAKSLLSSSKSVIEFAKRTLYKGVDISPIPISEFLSALYYLPDAISFARKYHLTFPALLKALGFGYKVRSTMFKHIGRLNSRVRALMFAYHLPDSDEATTAVFQKGNPQLSPPVLVEVLKQFKTVLIGKYLPRMKLKLTNFKPSSVIIKEIGEQTTNLVMERLAFGPFLQTWVERVLPNQDNLSVSTHVEDWEPFIDLTAKDWETAFGLRPKVFTIPKPSWKDIEAGNQTNIVVPPGLFNKVETFKRSLFLDISRVVKLLVETPRMLFVKDATALLYTIQAIRYNRTPFAIYTSILAQLRAINKAGSGDVLFERPLEAAPKFGIDNAQMQLWREFTKVILMVLPKVTDKSKITTTK
jgi:hypothetical protein